MLNARSARIHKKINKTRKPYSRRTYKNIRKRNIHSGLSGGASLEIVKDKPSFTVIYNNPTRSKHSIQITKSDNGIDLTTANNNNYLDFQPIIKLTLQPIRPMQTMQPIHHLSQQYLIVMIDKDAPHGKETLSGNKPWTHWVATMKPGDNINNMTLQNIVSYRKPTPPEGTHRYYITVYSSNGTIPTLPSMDTKGNKENKERGTYFDTKLNIYLESNVRAGKLILLDEIMFEVSSIKY